MNNMLKVETSRRQLIKASATAVGGLSIGLSMNACSSTMNRIDEAGNWEANAWLEIAPDNSITFTLDRVEMGQGTYTGITTLIAEELDVTPESINVVFAPVAKVYRNPLYGMQATGGSTSLSTSWMPIREAGAVAKSMLLTAGAELLQVSRSELKTEGAHVIHQATGKKISYGSLTRLASKQKVPSDITLKDKKDFRYIGKQNKRLDSQLKVIGKAGYGIDAEVEGMRYAVVKHSPYIGGTLHSHNGSELLNLKGVEKVVETEAGVAVVASSYWQARKASEQLKVEWNRDPEGPLSTDAIFDLYRKAAEEDEGDSKRSEGDVIKTLGKASSVIEVDFEAPFLAHATMEPMNCTAWVRNGKADIWTSTQAPDIARAVVAKLTNVDQADVTVHSQFLGGGFGRRLAQDFVGEAAEISFKAGVPVKLVWSREDDTQNDVYRPAALHKMKASFDEQGKLEAWDHQVVAPKLLEWAIWDAAPAMFPGAPKFLYSTLSKSGLMMEGIAAPADTSPYEGAEDIPYQIPNIEVRHTKADAGVPVGYWRSVGHSHTAFAVECFVDELAHKAGQDAYQFRRSLLAKDSRVLKVLDLAAEKAQWGRKLEAGVYQGIAVHESFGSYVAQVAEIKVSGTDISVQKVVCAVDCGQVVNPDIVTMQMESGIIFGITAALYGEITIQDGQIQQSNFHDYPMLRMNQSPVIETHIVDSDETPTGVGEPGLPPTAPAIANALFHATGKRFRSTPLKLA